MAIDQNAVFEKFRNYPWHSDKVYQAGAQKLIGKLSNDMPDDEKDIMYEMQLLKSRHFYFSKYHQSFDIEEYLKYEQQRLDQQLKDKEVLFQSVEKYEYDKDGLYTKGLQSIIPGWIEQQINHGLWDQEKLDYEFMKVRAFYYHSNISPVDVAGYLKWKTAKERTSKPACPFASSWQNKKTAIATISSSTNGPHFIVFENTKGLGAKYIVWSSPTTQNIFTVTRLKELHRSVLDNDSNITALFITSAISHVNISKQTNDRIETRDTRIVSKGMAYDETYKMTQSDDVRQVSMNALADTYYDLVEDLLTTRKTKDRMIVTFSNGRIPLNIVYLLLSVGFLRVVTEHSLLNFQLKLSHSPIPPLLLLNACYKQSKDKKGLSLGTALYLALGAPDYSLLRGPELLRLGMADLFVPEAKWQDGLEKSRIMASCAPPHTYSAISLTLMSYHSYAGPDRISVWEDNIEAYFGSAKSLDELEELLKADNSKWSRSILDYWKTLPPVLLRVIFKAVHKSKDMTPTDILVLERRLNKKWRQTEDYKQWLNNDQKWITAKESEKSVCFYFDDVEKSLSIKPILYEAIEEKQHTLTVCPVTGQQSSTKKSGCPVTGQNRSLSDSQCPITNLQPLQSDNKCPVTGQMS